MLVVPDVLDVVVGVIERLPTFKIVVAHVVHALVGLHNGVAFSSAVLFLPRFGVGKKLVKVHTEKLGSALSCAFLADESGLQLLGNRGEIGQDGRLTPAELHVVFHAYVVAFLALLRGNENYAEGCTATVYG